MGTIFLWIYFIFLWITQIGCKELRVVCYYTNWSVYRPGSAKFSPQNINPYLCTHLVYAFGGFTKENTFKPFDKYQDIEKGGYAKFTGLKTYNKNLKTLLAVGGWNEGSTRFSPMVASSERRKEFVKNAVKFLRLNHFDGLDLDWEYPSFRDGGKPRDRDNYAQLVQELREEFERESEKTGRTRLLLTMAVPAGIEYINKGYDVPKLMKYLDWMNLLSYDYHSAFEPSVNHHAPLYPLEEESEYNYDTELNIDHTIKHYLEAGAISEKLVLGIPTYGRSYTLFNPDANEIGAPADGPGEMGDATRENGYLAYYEICENVKNGDWTVVQPNDDAMGPYAYKDNQWVGYDDEAIARKKAQYVAEKGLGGIMFWAIDNDDFRGTCHNKPYPIIEAAKESLVEAMGLNEENAISKPATSLKSRTRSRNKEVQKERVQNSGGRQSEYQKPSRRRVVKNRAQVTEKPEVPQPTRRRRPTTTQKVENDSVRKESGSSLVVTTPSYKTPEPPTTPDPGGDFKCEDEGFFPHPRDCKKYFWCLNGPSELGIIAHQFTCPAGLYFNKAASSCDYTQNVLCNKKTAKSTTPKPTKSSNELSSTTEKIVKSTTTAAPKRDIFSFSTRRPPPKITAATSKTTFTTTTSTASPEYDDEYEYVDEEEADDITDSEDPRVIKELLELIKKAGGIDELEKQLNFRSEATSSGNTNNQSTPSSISKKLYERVLARTKFADTTTKKSTYRYNSINRNSRGPQNEGLISETSAKKENEKSRPKYSTITRLRASKINEEENEEEPVEKEEEKTNNKEYVTLRRRPSNPVNDQNEDDEEEKEEKEIVSKGIRSTTIRSPYVTLRRSRPSTVPSNENEKEDPNLLNRDVLGEELSDQNNEPINSSPSYSQIQRQKSSSTEAITSKYKQISRGTTTASPPIEEVSTDTSALSDSNSLTNFSAATNNTLKTISEEPPSSTLDENLKLEIKPQLLEPRPFSINSNVRSTTKPSVESSKDEAQTTLPSTVAPRFRPGFRRSTTSSPKALPTTKRYSNQRTRTTRLTRRRLSTSSTTARSRESSTSRNLLRVRSTTTTATPQIASRQPKYVDNAVVKDLRIAPSNQDIQEENHTTVKELAAALYTLQKAPLPSTTESSKLIYPENVSRNYVDNNNLEVVTKVPAVSRIPSLGITKAIIRRPTSPPTFNAFDKINPVVTKYTYKPITDYDYYDDGDVRLVGTIPEHSKVLIHSSGAIHCLDQGNFPHPVSCKKFISCAKMENGKVLGWEYTCPKNLSYDPVGGMCNWSAGLGCNE